ncbi:YecA family protein [Pseudomonas sp.]|uniref:YecA family protein n=1 Tax=unclassified Pseudomonas TaxID=196821 RepID=UPI0031D425BE
MSFADQLSRLQAFLDADDLHEEALDYVAAHGYLTALAICPEEVPDREWIDALFAEPPHYRSDEERSEIEGTLVQLKAHITRLLASDEELELPCEPYLGDEPDDSDIRGWCIGFMEGVFLREAVWFEQAEEEVSELLLPIMVGSGLFDEQPEFDEIARDRQLVDDMVAQIPELLTNLFLLCQAPEEKPALLKPRTH